MTKFEDVKKELRDLFMKKGWGQEIEGISPEYYKVYITVLEFIEEKFYKTQPVRRRTEKDKKGYSFCEKCGKKRVYYRKNSKDYICRECKAIFKM